MGSGLSCFWSRGSNGGKGFRPFCQNKGKENDSMRGKDYVARDDWLSADHGEIQALGHFSIKVIPSVLAEVDRGGSAGEFGCTKHRGSAGITTFGRSKSGKTQKRVSFRLPEQDDIITYNSPARGSTETLL